MRTGSADEGKAEHTPRGMNVLCGDFCASRFTFWSPGDKIEIYMECYRVTIQINWSRNFGKHGNRYKKNIISGGTDYVSGT